MGATVSPAWPDAIKAHGDVRTRTSTFDALRRHGQYRLHTLGLALAVLLCLVRALSLLVLTVSPNTVMNRLMRTTTIAAIGVVVVGYATIPLRFTTTLGTKRECLRQRLAQSVWHRRLWQTLTACVAAVPLAVRSRVESCRHHRFTILKIADLTVQCVSLIQQLEAGLPVRLVAVFAAIVALHAAATAVMLWTHRLYRGRMHTLIDTAFDFVVAIVYPARVLLYCVSSFSLDRALLAINERVFIPSAFERKASIYADPAEVAIIRYCLDSLRITTRLDLVTRVGVNCMLCFRCHTLAQYVEAARTSSPPSPSQANLYPRSRAVSVAFVALAIAIVTGTFYSIDASAQACASYPECVQAAHRWVASPVNDADETTGRAACPCIALIDHDLFVPSYDAWQRPHDVTDRVAQLALSGDLQTLQLVNRALPTLPEALRKCTKLKHISLLYTHTVALPDWTRELTQLEFLLIEGKMDATSLQSLPTDLFADMRSLTYLQLAQHPLPQLPSLDGLTRLKILSLAFLLHLDELPSFTHLERLESFNLVALPRIETLPDLDAATHLQSLTGFDRGAFCCNGFLDGQCDLSDAKCRVHPLWGTPAATCLQPSRYASPATLAYVRRFYTVVCGSQMIPRWQTIVPTEATVNACNGTLFRQCHLPNAEIAGVTGICTNKRWMAIACEVSATIEAMRRAQIAEGRGRRCDPQYEAWLGCT